ncbi:variant erythrocyte surface antigen-1, beta subunit, partial [Babesia divergens]
NDSHLASAVFFLEEFCQEVRADAFSGRLVEDLYDGLKEPCLRVSYYARSYTDHFRPRNLLDGPYKDALKPEMFKDYIEWLVSNIPGISESLEHLSNEFKGLSEKQLESAISVVLTIYGFEFHDVWTDKDFISSLRHKTSNLVNALKYLHGSLGKFSSDSFREPLAEAQSNLVFESSKWDDSHLASSIFFLREFCLEVMGETFAENTSKTNYDDLCETCWKVNYNVEPLTRTIEPSNFSFNPYIDALKPEKFNDYAKWLVKNIPEMEKSYKEMLKKSAEISGQQFEANAPAVISKYGFVINEYRLEETTDQAPSHMYATSDFLGSLNSLLTNLDKILTGAPMGKTPSPQDLIDSPESVTPTVL